MNLSFPPDSRLESRMQGQLKHCSVYKTVERHTIEPKLCSGSLEAEFFISFFNLNHPLLLSVKMLEIIVRGAACKKEVFWEGDRHVTSFSHSILMSAAASSPDSSWVGQKSVTVHVLLHRMY